MPIWNLKRVLMLSILRRLFSIGVWIGSIGIEIEVHFSLAQRVAVHNGNKIKYKLNRKEVKKNRYKGNIGYG